MFNLWQRRPTLGILLLSILHNRIVHCNHREWGSMATINKKELTDRIAEDGGDKHVVAKIVIQSFLDNIVIELGKGNRLEFRDFGVFEVRQRKGRKAHNPKTLEPLKVPPTRTVKFKPGRVMRQAISRSIPRS